MENPNASLNNPEQRDRIVKAMRKQSFCTLGTVSPAGRPLVTGIVYEAIDTTLYFHTMATSAKATNIGSNDNVAVCIPVRKAPAGPPFTIHYQASAEVLPMDHPEIVELLAAGKLTSISGHGALDEPDGCFVRITPNGIVNSYGIGVSMLGVIRDPLHVGPRRVRV